MKTKLIPAAIVLGAGVFMFGLASSANAASLFEKRVRDSLIADRKANAVGDLVTIVIQETSKASTDASTERTKESKTDAAITTFLFPSDKRLVKDGEKPAFAWDSSRESSGAGKSSASTTLETRVTARVIDVQPNGNMLIEATREVEIYGSSVKVVLTGLVRPDDVAADNTVESTLIADAKITYQGPLVEVMKRGWLERVMDFLNIF
ncbi:MAG: flagellar basal body L-ring protein FlgH [Verrucomicrobia bacterium]|nr:flagellar basal body L-ring protein FlgH [Verrucomicrobiota bacterium]